MQICVYATELAASYSSHHKKKQGDPEANWATTPEQIPKQNL